MKCCGDSGGLAGAGACLCWHFLLAAGLSSQAGLSQPISSVSDVACGLLPLCGKLPHLQPCCCVAEPPGVSPGRHAGGSSPSVYTALPYVKWNGEPWQMGDEKYLWNFDFIWPISPGGD